MSQPLMHQTDGDYLTIGALAKLCGITVRTLRYYEEMDLIGPVKRTEGKYRLYNQHSLKRIKAILALQDLGYSLEEVLVTLGHYSKSRSYSREEMLSQTRQSLEQQLVCISEKMAKMETFREEVKTRLDLLDKVCTPCSEVKPQACCPDNCNYLEVHN